MRDALDKYKGQTIGVNVEEPGMFWSVVLKSVGDVSFTVTRRELETTFCYPFSSIFCIAEAALGHYFETYTIDSEGSVSHEEVDLLVQVRHTVTMPRAKGGKPPV